MIAFIYCYRYAVARGVAPRLDTSQDIMNTSASLMDGRQMISFTRPIDTGDTADDFSLDMCINLIWAFGGAINDFNTMPASIGVHNAASRGIFNEQICLNMCAPGKELLAVNPLGSTTDYLRQAITMKNNAAQRCLKSFVYIQCFLQNVKARTISHDHFDL